MSTSPIEASVKEIIGAYTDFKAELNAEVDIKNAAIQIIDVNLPNITRCKNISISENAEQTTTVIQVSNSDVVDSMSTLVNSKIDAKLNQLNEYGRGYVKSIAEKAGEANLKIDETLKYNFHTSVFVGVRSFAKTVSTSNQKIVFNDKGSAKYLECDTLKISIDSKINTQLTQLTTLMLDNVKSNSGNYEKEVEKLINGTDKGNIGKFFPSIVTSSLFKIIYIGIGVIGIVLLAGIIALMVVLVVTTKRKNNSIDKLYQQFGATYGMLPTSPGAFPVPLPPAPILPQPTFPSPLPQKL